MTTRRDGPRGVGRDRPRRPARPDGGDGVLVALLKAAAYSQAPRLTFTVLHPKQAAQLKKLPFDLRTAYAPRVAALLAAALALPVGVALGRSLERRAAERRALGHRPAPRASSPKRVRADNPRGGPSAPRT